MGGDSDGSPAARFPPAPLTVAVGIGGLGGAVLQALQDLPLPHVAVAHQQELEQVIVALHRAALGAHSASHRRGGPARILRPPASGCGLCPAAAHRRPRIFRRGRAGTCGGEGGGGGGGGGGAEEGPGPARPRSAPAADTAPLHPPTRTKRHRPTGTRARPAPPGRSTAPGQPQLRSRHPPQPSRTAPASRTRRVRPSPGSALAPLSPLP